jgi:hypothetical protein
MQEILLQGSSVEFRGERNTMSTISSADASTSATRTLEDLQKSQRTASQTLDMDAFLQLLVEQMANQDRLSYERYRFYRTARAVLLVGTAANNQRFHFADTSI